MNKAHANVQRTYSDLRHEQAFQRDRRRASHRIRELIYLHKRGTRGRLEWALPGKVLYAPLLWGLGRDN